MNKKALLSLFITVSIAAAGCGSKKVSSRQASENNNTNSNVSSTSSVLVSKPDSKDDYSKYSGDWVTENRIKYDLNYGIYLSINTDKDGSLKGTISNCTNRVTHISNVDIKGKIENNNFKTTFSEDGWGHSGTIEMNFKDSKIILNIKYNDGKSGNSDWGIGEGNYILINNKSKVNSTLSDLKNGGLEVIDKQCFKTKFENFGSVKLISGLKRDIDTIASFYLVDDNENVLYKFPDFYGNYKGQFNDIIAISFADANGDGLKDMIVVASYKSSNSTKIISSIYFQKGKEFASDKTFDDKLNSSSSNKNVSSILKFTKENLKK